jgi:putative oxidoreductase
VNAVLWLLQIVLALVFLALGLLMVTRSRERLLRVAGWVEDFPEWVVTTVGVLELLAAAGLVLPGVFGVAGVLVPLAALGLVVLLIGAIVTHLLRGEQDEVGAPVALLLAAAVVAAGRLSAWPLP